MPAVHHVPGRRRLTHLRVELRSKLHNIRLAMHIASTALWLVVPECMTVIYVDAAAFRRGQDHVIYTLSQAFDAPAYLREMEFSRITWRCRDESRAMLHELLGCGSRQLYGQAACLDRPSRSARRRSENGNCTRPSGIFPYT
jgi:hypothetical protein